MHAARRPISSLPCGSTRRERRPAHAPKALLDDVLALREVLAVSIQMLRNQLEEAAERGELVLLFRVPVVVGEPRENWSQLCFRTIVVRAKEVVVEVDMALRRQRICPPLQESHR